ncbi:serine hydrolase domain-containing protein [Steroidobacter sp.]|uniref:serine hydrolase domain-containing protein n=1 Tax=Steroidobacter sp. TaxID=1978227 RepID=UPI001A55E78A|nr:serine hydrolase domain-containing protein [Steroidobacter sp.]MBL8268948.1 beta-lactamase family protein [Steroidobacter sp.]
MWNRSLSRWVAGWSAALLLSVSVVSIASEPNRAAAVDAVFAPLRGNDRPGAAVGIYQGGKLVYSQGYGMANLDAGTPITADTVFNLASVSKQFTAVSAALLAREGKLDLQADIRKYLPNQPDLGTRITVADLIHHTSGIRDYIALAALSGHDDQSLIRQRHAIAILERQRGLNFQPGTRYAYSNSGYALLAEVVQAAAGKSLNEFMKERLFKPLGMNDTRVRDDLSRIEPGYAAGYERGEEAGRPWARAVYNRVAVGPGNVLSTVGDLAKWAGNFAHPVVGDAQFIEQLSAPAALRDGTPVNYGFGLTRQEVIGHRVVTHTGGISGFRTVFVFFPDDDFAVVVLANHSYNFEPAVEQIAKIYLQPKAVKAPKKPASITPKATVLAGLAGTYLGSEGPMLTVRQDGTQLIFAAEGHDQGAAKFWADGTFTVGDRDSTRYRAAQQQGATVGIDVIGKSNDGERVQRLARVSPFTPAASELATLTGVYYGEEIDTSYSVSIDAGKVTLRSLYLDAPQALQPTTRDRFEAQDGALEGLEVTVVRNSAGQPTGLRLRFGSTATLLAKR